MSHPTFFNPATELDWIPASYAAQAPHPCRPELSFLDNMSMAKRLIL